MLQTRLDTPLNTYSYKSYIDVGNKLLNTVQYLSVCLRHQTHAAIDVRHTLQCVGLTNHINI
jgi:hypothetical protein